MGLEAAKDILSQMKKLDVDRDLLSRLDHNGWQELGVTSGIQRAKLIRAAGVGGYSQESAPF